MLNQEWREWEEGEFLDILMPSMDKIRVKPQVPYELNNIFWINSVVYGNPNSGKTEFIRWLSEIANKRYSPDILGTFHIGHYLREFLDCPMLEPKPVQILFFDDLAGLNKRKLSFEQVTTWCMMRHVMKDIIKSQDGLLLTFLGTQSYFGLPKDIRESFTGFFAKSFPSNPYDECVVRKFVGDEGVALLKKMSMDRLRRIPHEEFVVFRIAGLRGYVKSPMASVNHLQPWKYFVHTPIRQKITY